MSSSESYETLKEVLRLSSTGHLVKRGNKWTAVINVTDDDGNRKQRWIATGKTRKNEANEVLVNTLAEMNKGGFTDITNVTIKDFLNRWLDDVVSLTASPKTERCYRSIVHRHLISSFGNEYLRRLTAPEIQTYYRTKRTSGSLNQKGEPTGKPLAANTIRKHHIILRQALNQAIEWGLIARNPTDGVRAPGKSKPKIAFLTPDETAMFLREAEKSSRYYDIYLLAFGTGMRKGELLALHWADAHLDSLEISVRFSLSKAGYEPVIKMPKSNDGWRTIDISPGLATMLARRKREYKELKKKEGFTDMGLVFSNDSGRPIDPDNLTSTDFDPLVKSFVNHEDPDKRIDRITFHGMRHSHAAHLIQRKESMRMISERLGHSSVSFTMDTYGHLMPGAQQSAASAIDDIMAEADG